MLGILAVIMVFSWLKTPQEAKEKVAKTIKKQEQSTIGKIMHYLQISIIVFIVFAFFWSGILNFAINNG